MATTAKAKPFIKWVGGKGQLTEQLDMCLPSGFKEWENVTYIEPFVGGGAMLFHMLQNYPNIKRAVINDVNPDLVNCYRVIKDNPEELIGSLQEMQSLYHGFTNDMQRKDLFLTTRQLYNDKQLCLVENAAAFMFLNRTCFNGLYRVNKKGEFNVPFGKYAKPLICDPATIRRDSELLQRVEILNGDFEDTFQYCHGNTFFYFDPPYRPLTATSSFTSYSKEGFNDDSQRRLKAFCDKIHAAGGKFMLSNSDCKDGFFDVLYQVYCIDRVYASRNINSDGSKRGKITEILVRNYEETQGGENDN